MGLSVRQVRLFLVRPTLDALGLGGAAAEDLVLGTAAHESGGFRFIDQVTRAGDDVLGPAIGLYQVEPATHDDVWTHFLRFRPALAAQVAALRAPIPDAHRQLALNLSYATAICRVIYFRRPEPLPRAGDVAALARYWKRFYNTIAGAGRPEQFIDAFNQYVREA